jgi:hypothetical protein
MTTGSVQFTPQQTGSERPVAPQAKPEEKAPVSTAAKSEARPEWLDPKFKDGAQLAESYKLLEAEYTRLKQGAKPEDKPADSTTPNGEAPKAEAKPEEKKPDDKKPEDTKPEDKAEEAAKKELEAKGVDVNAMSERFWETGELAADDKATLVEALKDKLGDDTASIIEDFAQSKKDAMAYRDYKTYEPLGGKDASAPIVAWGKEKLNDAQREAINTLWSSNDINKVNEGSKLLRTLYDAANGKAPSVVLNGDLPASVSTDVYNSQEEMRADMSDKRYREDPAFRAKVAAKLGRSNI